MSSSASGDLGGAGGLAARGSTLGEWKADGAASACTGDSKVSTAEAGATDGAVASSGASFTRASASGSFLSAVLSGTLTGTVTTGLDPALTAFLSETLVALLLMNLPAVFSPT